MKYFQFIYLLAALFIENNTTYTIKDRIKNHPKLIMGIIGGTCIFGIGGIVLFTLSTGNNDKNNTTNKETEGGEINQNDKNMSNSSIASTALDASSFVQKPATILNQIEKPSNVSNLCNSSSASQPKEPFLKKTNASSPHIESIPLELIGSKEKNNVLLDNNTSEKKEIVPNEFSKKAIESETNKFFSSNNQFFKEGNSNDSSDKNNESGINKKECLINEIKKRTDLMITDHSLPVQEQFNISNQIEKQLSISNLGNNLPNAQQKEQRLEDTNESLFRNEMVKVQEVNSKGLQAEEPFTEHSQKQIALKKNASLPSSVKEPQNRDIEEEKVNDTKPHGKKDTKSPHLAKELSEKIDPKVLNKVLS